MASPSFTINTKHLGIEEIGNQLRAIKEVPCTIHIYDRTFRIDTLDEIWAFIQGLEIGSYLYDDQQSKNRQHNAFQKATLSSECVLQTGL